MRRSALDRACAACRTCAQQKRLLTYTTRRAVQISATPSSTEPTQSLNVGGGNGQATPAPDARFEVLGSPFSLLSASISASQNLYSRRGTLVGFNGKPEDAISTLSILGPFVRASLGIPFLYQKITSTTPFTALIATKSPFTSMAIVHLDGRLDWMIAQRNALLAWTGHTLSLSPRLNTAMSIAHWGSTNVTGRGLVALAGKGQIQQIHLRAGDEYVVHPSHVIAYSIASQPPQPYRFKASALRLQVPSLTGWLPETRFWNEMRKTTTWRWMRDIAFTLRTWARRTIWGDRLFLQFRGPANILIQSRGSTLSEILSARDVNEIADAPAGAVSQALTLPRGGADKATEAKSLTASAPTGLSFAQVSRDGKVNFEQSEQKPNSV